MKTYTFYVSGMHCDACVLLIESELGDLKEVSQVKVSLATHAVQVSGDFGNQTDVQVAEAFTNILKPRGYGVSTEKHISSINWKEFNIALPIAVAFIAIFIVLQKFGLVNLVTSSNVSYGTAFFIGLIASVSTCMAVVGGLVLSMSASFAKDGDRIRPQILFHGGRLISFFILGGLIGLLGSVFQLGGTGVFVMSLIVAVVLLILGINLLDVFPWVQKFQPTLPQFIGRRVQAIKKINHTFTPVMLGLATFFLPCGFTQSMQIYSLTTGNFWTAAFTMLFFALGTLPVLALLSFSSVGIKDKPWAGAFFKTAGLIVLFFGVFNLINSFVAIGLIPPLFNF